MAKRTKKREKPNDDGPYLAAAIYCERAIEDKQDGAFSAIRIVDQLNIRLSPDAPPGFPSREHPIPMSLSGLLCFKTGETGGGEHALRLVAHSPSGKAQVLYEENLILTPQPHGGANLRLNTVVLVQEGGLFWLDVFLDGKRLTRMPLQITVERGEAPPNPPPGQQKTSQA